MNPDNIIDAIKALPLSEQKKLLAELQKHIEQAEKHSADSDDWQDDFVKSSLISPEDEKNIQHIWKSPGGC